MYALDPILPFLRKRHTIWEPAVGKGRISSALQAYGYTVVTSGLDTLLDGTTVGQDFLTYEPIDHWDVIISNPPYSIKREFLRRCYTLGNPFALLLPVETIGSGEVQRMMQRYGGELLLLNRRVNFVMNDGPDQEPSGKASAAQFPVFWYCWKLLPEKIVYGQITHRHPEQLLLVDHEGSVS